MEKQSSKKKTNIPNEEEEVDLKTYYKSIVIRVECIHIQIDKNTDEPLAGVVQWNEHWTVNQRVTGLIPSQGTCLGCRPGPQ